MLELLDKVVHKPVIEIFTTQVSITSSGFDFENTLLDGQKRHIEGSSAKIKNKDVMLTNNFFVETVRDGGCSWFVDDTKDVHTRNCSSILGGLTLRVVEVCRDNDNSISDSSTQV